MNDGAHWRGDLLGGNRDRRADHGIGRGKLRLKCERGRTRSPGRPIGAGASHLVGRALLPPRAHRSLRSDAKDWPGLHTRSSAQTRIVYWTCVQWGAIIFMRKIAVGHRAVRTLKIGAVKSDFLSRVTEDENE